MVYESNELYHHGVKSMKWRVRRNLRRLKLNIRQKNANTVKSLRSGGKATADAVKRRTDNVLMKLGQYKIKDLRKK